LVRWSNYTRANVWHKQAATVASMHIRNIC
jgi:hypothetical protein